MEDADLRPTLSAARVAHNYYPAANAEQRIIRARMTHAIERRDAEWQEIVNRLQARLLETTK